jgi:hypothetical protein
VKRTATWLKSAMFAAIVVGCARMGAPPGAPPDFAAPVLLSTFPESVTVLADFDDWVEFRFDEVISEGGQPSFGFGSGGLERLVLISPDSGVPRVRWRRNRIEVKPREGWRPGVVYRVELGAGLSDISPRTNTRDSAAVITFTTGAPIPTRFIEGRAVDWMQRRFVPRAVIEAMLLPDSLVYRTVTDSTGRFRFGPLPDGEFVVAAALDANGNRRRDPREAWDTVRALTGATALGEIWMFPRDTAPPRIESSGPVSPDSFTIAIPLTQPVDPNLSLGPEAITIIRLSDSTVIPAASGYPQSTHDSIYFPIDSARRAVAARAAFVRDSIASDSALAAARDTAAVPDTTRRAAIPPRERPSEGGVQRPRPGRADAADSAAVRDDPTQPRPRIGTRFMIRLNGFVEPGQRYAVELRGVRALSGTVADTLRAVLVIPEARTPAPARP